MRPLTLTTTMGVYRGDDRDECIEVTVAGTVERFEGEDPRLEVTGFGFAALFHPHLVLSDREVEDAKVALCDEYERLERAGRVAA